MSRSQQDLALLAYEQAFTAIGQTVTFAEIGRLSGTFAAYLAGEAGRRRGARIAILYSRIDMSLENWDDWRATEGLALRLFQVTPTIEPTPATWQSILAKLVHIALYALMVGMPVVGWLVLSGEGKPIPFDLPALMAENESLAEELEEAHKLAGKIGYFLIGIHALAALVHHYFQKDNTLKRMLPWG